MTPQELKESILWNAIQGKFTTQDPRESVSGVLGKTQITPVAEEDAYFEIPGNWCWARIGEIFDLVNGKAFKPTDWSESGIPIVRIQNLNDPNASYNCFSGEIEEKFILHGGELLFSWSGTPGTSFGAFIWNGGHAVLNQHIFIVYPKIKLDYEYAKYALNGELRIFIAKAHGGAGLKHITRKEFDSCFLPIPPLAEQKRIVAKIEELVPLIERYEAAWSRLEDFNKRFPVDMQKSILQMAIQGKLVEQRPEEGTGEELYKQIQAEKQALIKAGKIKKEKPLPEIAEDEIPFEIPESWKWIRWGTVINVVSARRVHQSDWRSEGIPFYRAREIAKLAENDYVENDLFISQDLFDEFSKSGVPHPGDLMVTAVGTLGKTYIVKPEDRFYYKDASVICFENYGHIDSKYLRYVMQSEMMMNQIRGNSSGTTVATLTMVRMVEYLLPLPPLAEQKRIVARLEQLLPLCELCTGKASRKPVPVQPVVYSTSALNTELKAAQASLPYQTKKDG